MQLVISSPEDGFVTNQNTIAVSWIVDGVEQTTDTSKTLTEGENVVIRSFTDAAGNIGTASVRVTLDIQSPVVVISSPVDGFVTNQSTIAVSWTIDGVEQTTEISQTLTEGENAITRSFIDAAGNTGSASILITLDTQAPVVVISSPVDGFVTNQNTIAVSWTVDGVEQTTEISQTLTEGENVITRSFTDAAGNTGSASVQVTLDTQAPVVAISSPVDGFITNQSTIAVDWNVDGVEQTTDTSQTLTEGENVVIRSFTDAAGNIGTASVRVTLDIQSPVVVISSPVDGFITNQNIVAVSWTVDGVEQTTEISQTLTEGENVITRSFTDAAGNTGSASVLVTLDTQVPVVAITAPAEGYVTNHTPITVSWTVDGVEQTTEISQNLTEGENVITRNFTDAAGNIGSASVLVTLDTQAPMVVISSPIDGFITNQNSAAVSWTVDGIEQATEINQNLIEGENVITRSFTDAAGNTGSASVRVTLDTQAPVVVISSPANGTVVYETPIDVIWTVDGINQSTQLSENLVEGANRIIREFSDEAGNIGADTIIVNYQQGCYQIANTSLTISNEDTLYENRSLCIVNSTVHIQGFHNFDSIALDNATIVVDTGIRVSSIVLINRSILSHEETTVDREYGLRLIAENVILDQSSRIDVAGQGYVGDRRIDGTWRGARTLGNAVADISGSSAAAGSYGGRGAFNSSKPATATYGDPWAPYDLGSGGGAYTNYANMIGGDGGGRVWIEAKKIVNDGLIRANGDSLPSIYSSGCGSGGAIAIFADTLLGTGSIKSDGGGYAAYSNYGGGGGRIRIACQNEFGIDLQKISALGGQGSSNYGKSYNGTVIISVNNLKKLYSWNPEKRNGFETNIIFNSSDLTYAGGTIVIKNSGLTIDGKYELDSMIITNGTGEFSSYVELNGIEIDSGSVLIVNDSLNLANLDLTNNSTLITAIKPIFIDYLSILNNSMLSHKKTTTESEYGLKLYSKKIYVDQSSQIDVAGRGYVGDKHIDGIWRGARTLGNAIADISGSNAAAGSYGGRGAFYSSKPAAATYGDPWAPYDLGSGGGAYTRYSQHYGGDGGGRVWIEAEKIVLDGLIRANGDSLPSIYSSGCGSGGAIAIFADTLLGTGSIKSDGGGYAAYSNYGGGGGRIRIACQNEFGIDLQKISALGGQGSSNYGKSYNGTVIISVNNLKKLYSWNPDKRNGFEGSILFNSSDSTFLGGNLVIQNNGLTVNGQYEFDSVTILNGTCEFTSFVELNILEIDSGSMLTINDSVHLDNLKLNNNSTVLTATKPVHIEELSIVNNSLLTHKKSTTDSEYGLKLYSKKIFIDESSRIDVTGCGYVGNRLINGSWRGARTFGNAVANISGESVAAGSYGGRGAFTSTPAASTYGNPWVPYELGSGGGAYTRYSQYYGGDGGGRIWIEAQNIVIDGLILANGDSLPSSSYSGCGSGGAITVFTDTLVGAGSIRSDGGGIATRSNYGGGGGRIRIACRNEFNIDRNKISALGGLGSSHGKSFNGTVIISEEMGNDLYAWNPELRNGFEGSILLDSAEQINIQSKITIKNSGLSLDGKYQIDSVSINNGTLEFLDSVVLKSIEMDSSSTLTVSSGLELDSLKLINNCKLVTSNNPVYVEYLSLQSGSMITHKKTTINKEYGLKIVAQKFFMDATSKIDVSGLGYVGDKVVGGNWQGARTFNNSEALISSVSNDYNADIYVHGGSHGGVGGGWSKSLPFYGSPFNCFTLGSGGGAFRYYNSQYGGDGGGRVWIETGIAFIDGEIIAHGMPSSSHSGGGAGGSIYIGADTLAGNGIIRADGGRGGYKRGGGGGRICLNAANSFEIDLNAISAVGVDSAENGTAIVSIGTGNENRNLYVLNYNGIRVSSDTVNIQKADTRFDNGNIFVRNSALKVLGTHNYKSFHTINGKVVWNGEINPLVLVVDSGSALSVGSTVALDSLTVDNRSSIVTGGLIRVRNTLNLTNHSSLLQKATTTDTEYKMHIIARYIFVDSTSRMDAAGCGYVGDKLVNGKWRGARTLDNTMAPENVYGGSHGGRGQGGSTLPVYGSALHPQTLGSGGGVSRSEVRAVGGSGGGFIKIECNHISIEGTMTVDGGLPNQYGAAGAGGSIWVVADTVLARGTLSANGGYKSGASGGGGRICLQAHKYWDIDTSLISVKHGTLSLNKSPGTVVFLLGDTSSRTAYFKSDTVSAVHAEINAELATEDSSLHINNIHAVNIAMRIASGSIFNSIKTDGAKIDVTSEIFADTIVINNSSVLQSGRQINVGLCNVIDSSYLTHPPVDPKTPEICYGLVIKADDVFIDSTSTIDVSGKGYPTGFTFGGELNRHDEGSGGSHGGRGYLFSSPIYGNEEKPVYPGGGGGTFYSSHVSPGGGVVKLEANRLYLNGNIYADGKVLGAGGSIWLSCDTIFGTGLIQANAVSNSMTGGGGRIAIDACSIPENLEDRVYVNGYENGTFYLNRLCSPDQDTAIPLVQITYPPENFHVNCNEITIEWRVNGIAQSDNNRVTLFEGNNIVIRSATGYNGKTGADTIAVFFDKVNPDVRITYPAENGIVDKPEIVVEWTVDGNRQIDMTTEKLNSGFNTIIRTFTDVAGNTGSDTVHVTYDSLAVDLIPVDLVLDIQHDPQTLVVSGMAQVDIVNIGSLWVSGTYSVVIFEDYKHNQQFDLGTDHVIGQANVSVNQGPGDTVTCNVDIAGTMAFAGNRLFAAVDSRNEWRESNEENNCRSSMYDCEPKEHFSFKTEWSFDSLWDPRSEEVFSVPIVANMTDDNMDGIIDTNDIPDIIFLSSQYEVFKGYLRVRLRCISGDGSRQHFVQETPMMELFGAPAVGDIDNDGLPEIVVPGNYLIAFENDGTRKWENRTAMGSFCNQGDALCSSNYEWWRSAEITDIDKDGVPEIIAGNRVFNNDGTLRWKGSAGTGHEFSTVVDINMDGSPDLLAGNTVYNSNGDVLWKNETFPDGFVAIANFDDDTFPEIVLSGMGKLYLLEHTGEVKWGPFEIPDNSEKPWYAYDYGGPPIITDFDNDGQPEIGIAGYGFTVLETDGSVKWGYRFQDWNGITTAGVFDVDGDGIPEVFHSGEDSLRVLRGIDGKQLYSQKSSTATFLDFPVVADVDNDKQAEILMTGNSDYQHNGLHIWGSVDSSWMPTRTIWNQHSYHITNVENSGRIPAGEQHSWLTHNSFRVNQQTYRTGCNDLTISRLKIDEPDSLGLFRLSARVGNGGTVTTSAPVHVAFYYGNPDIDGHLLGVIITDKGLVSGSYRDVSLALTQTLDTGYHTIAVRVDDNGSGNGSFDEKDERNNFLIDTLYYGNHSPEIVSTPVMFSCEGEIYSYDVDAVDPNQNDSLTFRLLSKPAGMHINSVTGLITWTPGGGDAGVHQIIVSVYDTKGGSATQSYGLTISDVFNSVPYILSQPLTSATEGVEYRYDLIVIDSDDDHLTFVLTSAPEGMAITPYGQLLWIPSEKQAGDHQVIIEITDGRGEPVEQRFTIIVQDALNAPPTIYSQPVLVTEARRLYQYQIAATDPEGSALIYSLETGPETMEIDSITGLVTWNVIDGDAGSHVIKVIVRDMQSVTAWQEYSIQVIPFRNNPPIFTSEQLTSATENQQYTYQTTVSDVDGDAVTFALISAPASMAISSTGLVQWIPEDTDAGSFYEISIAAIDTYDTTVQKFQLHVNKTNDSPVILSTPPSHAAIGAPYIYQVMVTDPDGDNLYYELLQKPLGMHIEADGLIRWPDDGNRISNAFIELKVYDDSGSFAMQSWTIDLVPDSEPPRVQIIFNPDIAAPYEEVAVTVDVTDNAGVNYTELTRNGVLCEMQNGQYRFTSLQEDTITFRAIAQDFAGNETSIERSLIVSFGADNVPPQVFVTAQPSIAFVGQPVTITVSCNDNTVVDNENVWLKVDEMYIQMEHGSAQYTPLKKGNLSIVATAYDVHGNYGEGSTLVRVQSVLNDTVAPEADITIVNDTTVVGQLVVTGTAYDENLAYWVLSYAYTGSNEYTEFVRGSHAVQNGSIGILDGTLLENGNYVLRLNVFDQNGAITVDQARVRVDGQAKTGIFTLNFNDLSLSLPGIELAVNRDYDSRRKTRGDFGIGWNLTMRSISLTENTIQGSGWSVQLTNPSHPLSGYTVVPLTDHTISIAIPGGRTQVFDAVARFYNRFDPSYGYFEYVPRPGTYSKLEPLDIDKDFYLMGSELYSVSGDFTESFNPDKYKLSFANGMSYVIDQKSGGVSQIIDANGNMVNFSNTSITHSANKSLQIKRDNLNRITSISDGTGRTVNYAYDPHGNLQKVIDPKGNITRFKYAPNHYLTEIIDARGVRATRTEYDVDGRMIRQINPLGDTLYFDHDLDNNREITRDFKGNVTEYIYDDRGNVTSKTVHDGNTSSTWEFSYDTLDNVISTRNPDGTMKSSNWDEQGNELSITDERGYTTGRTYNGRGQVLTETDPLNRTTRYEYDSRGNLLRTIGPDGTITSLTSYASNGNVLTEKDAMGNISSYEYDSQGRMTARIDPLRRRTGYVLDDRGNTVAETGPDGDTVKYAYDLNNNQIMSVNPLGDTVSSTFNVFNKLSSQTDGRGNITRFEYDIFGQLHKNVAPDNTFTEKEYDANGNVTATIDEVGRKTSFEYDAENRIIQTILNDGSYTRVEYDEQGRRTASIDAKGNRTEYEYDGVGNNTVVRDALGNETRYEYDAVNRRKAMVDALGQRTEYTYDDYDRLVRTTFADNTYSEIEYDLASRKTAEIDQERKRTEFSYDSTGNLRSVTDAMGYVTSYTYDKKNNRISQTDANSHTTTMQYDKLNRLIARIYPNVNTERFGYDENGNQVYKIDGNNDSTVYTYDCRNREVLKRFTNSGHTVATRYTDDGRPDTVTDQRGMTVYTYDTRGRQASVTNPDNTFIECVYDLNGNRTEQKTPFDTVVYGHDVLNRMSNVSNLNGVTKYFYNVVGNRDSVHNANGTSVKYDYDDLNRFINLTNYAPDQTVNSSYEYELNNAGKRTSVTESDGSRIDYTYDDCYKLTGETRTGGSVGSPSYNITYTYDNVGNRLTQERDGVFTSYSYNNRDQLIQEDSGGVISTYNYDPDGRMTNKTVAGTTTIYGWEDNHRMISVTVSGISVTYVYDHNEQRVSESSANNTTHYLIDYQLPYGQVIADLDENGEAKALYVYGLERISMACNGSTFTYISDGQGSIRNLTNSSGTVTDSYYYTAFGEQLTKTGTTENRFMYVGEQLDANVGFYYNRARWMDPSTGRFVSVDPFAGDPQTPVSLHKYLYAGVNPITNIDPTGESILNTMGSFVVNSIIRAQSFVLYNSIRIALFTQLIRGLSQKKLDHILETHHMLTKSQEIPHLISKFGTKYTEALIKNKTWFNPNWSASQVHAAVLTALRLATQTGVQAGNCVAKVGNETIILEFQKGQLHTAYGTYILTLKDFLY